jgi:predicted transcriptional regulator
MTQESVKEEIKKIMQCRYQKITALVITLKNLFPNATTVHDPSVQIESDSILQNDIRILFESLVHSLTIINKLYRLKDKDGNYISQREDYATALMLISPLFSSGRLDVSQGVRKYYQILVDEIGLSSSFNWKDLQILTGKSKTSCNRILQQLQELSLVRRAGKGYRSLYKYELIPQTENQKTTEIWEAAFEDFEDFKGFEPL